ncbi:glutamate racemase [bacterium]|nr:MAG: glutamate racemase [bacterium]
MKPDNKAAIGIFDSGIGGLTVVKSVMKMLPGEDIIYFGDTARVPYGIKSVETIREYAFQITDFLVKKQVKMILIACNTVAAAAESLLVDRVAKKNIPVLGVIDAGAKAALEVPSNHKRIGVIGTLATVGSGAYEKAIQEKNQDISVFSKACPLLVPIAEEGWADTDIARQTLEIYLESFQDKELDALILGCTHYPLFRQQILSVLKNPSLEIVDSADSIALKAKEVLTEKKLINTQEKGSFSCYVSDKPQRFQHLAELFLGEAVRRVEVISLPV